jgi:hypothetical protein
LRHRLVLAALVPVVVALGGVGTAQAAPSSGEKPANHGSCVSGSPQGGRSAVATDKNACSVPLVCRENEDDKHSVDRDRQEDTVTLTGSGPGSAGSALECRTSIPVEAGDTVSFSYELGAGTNACGGGVPRMFLVIEAADGTTTTENTIDSDPECAAQDDGTVTYTIKGEGTVTQVGFVYDRGDFGSVTYSDATVGGVTLDI